MLLGLIQTHADAGANENLHRSMDLIRAAATKGANVICMQELFLGPYFPQEEDVSEFDRAEAVPGPTTEVLGTLAAELEVVIVASLFEKRAAGLYHNCVAVLDADGKYLGKYRKMHIPDDPRFYEKFYFTPGDLGFKVFDTRYGKIGTLICWDQWFPEAARLASLQGAQVLLYPTAIGTWDGEMEYREEQLNAWQAVQRGHAVANGIFTAAINRVGREDELVFWGNSFVFGPMGETLYQCGEEEEIAVVPIDLNATEAARRGWPFLRDRRIDAYGGLSKRYLDDA